MHGHARVPHDFSDYTQPGWVMAGRWLQKNAKLFLKDKLPDKRYALIQDILGARARSQAAQGKPVHWHCDVAPERGVNMRLIVFSTSDSVP